jgi:hypothetical protein
LTEQKEEEREGQLKARLFLEIQKPDFLRGEEDDRKET